MQRREFITFLGTAAAGWKRAERPTTLLREARYLLLGLVSLATVTGLYFWLDVPLVAAAFTYLIVLVLLSLVSNLSSLIVLSFIGVGCLSYFFAPPIYSFRVDYPQEIITISAFVITSFVVSFLVTRARDANQRLEVTNKALRIENVERKRAEQALRESEANFRDYAETASDWFWEIDPDYKFTLLTENAFGSHAADRIGTACWDHALDLKTEPEKWRLVRATLDSRKPFRDFVYRGLSGNGSPMYVKASGKPVFDANGEFRGYRGAGSDVTEIMRAQEALRESERNARSAIDGIAGLVAITTPNGELETVNRQVFEYFGRSLEELKNWGTSDAVHPEDLPHVVEMFTKAVASGIPYQLDQRLRRFDGEYRWFDVRGLSIRDDSGRIARWYVLMTDIEDRTRALARLEQMQSDFAHMNRVATMGQLTASITHEVKQPITATATNAKAALRWLDRQPPNLEEARQMLADIVKDSHRAGDVIDRMRDLIKKAPPRKDRVEINGAIREVIELTYSEAAKNGVSVQTQFAESLPLIQGDRVQLQQVMLNLIINAIQAMSGVAAGVRELRITTENTELEGVRLAVRDSGPGLSSENFQRLFEPFYTTKPEGMGMGLSICRSIIEAHGGRLWAIPCEPQGALFQFTIPAT